VSRLAILGLLLLAACNRKTEVPLANSDRATAERQAMAKADADVRAADAAAR